jgi:GMP synthase (glutamine-hydrolysing)
MKTSSPHALVLSHVGFEDLGSLKTPLLDRGFSIDYIEVAKAGFPLEHSDTCDLLVVMGGPIGVYELDEYPFLKDEIACIRKRLQQKLPTLGICLGAQLMAAALGASVYPGKNGKEIGWSQIQAAQTRIPEWFTPLLDPDVMLFHWHGDTFDLPRGAQHIAKSQRYANQAFTIDNFALGLQFHPEVNAADLESWYVGHAAEMHSAGLTAAGLRADAIKYSQRLQDVADIFWNQWLNYIL